MSSGNYFYRYVGNMYSSSMCDDNLAFDALGFAQSTQHLAAVMLHELGHNWGSPHDNSGTWGQGKCEDWDECIMSPRPGFGKTMFSQTSIDYYNMFLNDLESRCFINRPEKAFIDICGDGVIGQNEECDCGNDLEACPKCCDTATCTFLEKEYKCIDGPCCDLNTCSYKKSGEICGTIDGETCDEIDTCDGLSNQCTNIHKANGLDCSADNGEEGYCKNGKCLTRNAVCKFLTGGDLIGDDESCLWNSFCEGKPCQHNVNAYPYYKCGNIICGIPCSQCGDKCKCDYRKYVDTTLHTSLFHTYDGQSFCLAPKYPQYEEVNGRFGMYMVENGTKCADNKVCNNMRCEDKDKYFNEDLPAEIATIEPIRSVCGNGIIEDGEDCDCGPNQCSCCDLETCKFTANGNSCFGDECKVCSGDGKCDRNAEDKTACDKGQGLCQVGICRSRNRQCRNLYSLSDMQYEAKSKPMEFYSKNFASKARPFNNGGFMLLNSRNVRDRSPNFIRRGPQDWQCGTVLCSIERSGVEMKDWYTKVRSCKPKINSSKNWCFRVRGFEGKVLFKKTDETYGGQIKYEPTLVDEGTPCSYNGKSGECKWYQEENYFQSYKIKYTVGKCILE